MINLAKSKATNFTATVTADPRWDLHDELMCQVFGFTLYGYVFGVGRVICFMDIPDIQQIVFDELTKLGIGQKYARGLIEAAHQSFVDKNDKSLYSQLVGVGHSHFGEEDQSKLANTIFTNTTYFGSHQS